MSDVKRRENALRSFVELAFMLPAATRRFGAERINEVYRALGGEGSVDVTKRSASAALQQLREQKRRY